VRGRTVLIVFTENTTPPIAISSAITQYILPSEYMPGVKKWSAQ
jgi:hypothetical protein